MDKARENRPKSRRPGTSGPGEQGVDVNFSLGGILGKFGSMVEKLVDLAEAGESFSRTGKLKGLDPQGKLHGVYGVSVKVGMGEQGERELKVEPFGNVVRDPSGDSVVEDVREPLVDVHEEDDHVLVLAEIPGVSKKDVQLELSGDRLTIRAQRGENRYSKEVILPGKFPSEKMRWDCTNGILKIRLER